jgi:rRNA-processing protein FCF1
MFACTAKSLCIKPIGTILERSGRKGEALRPLSLGPMQAVLLDTNALLLPFQFRLNLEAELRRLLGDHVTLVPSPVLEELRGLTKSTKEARAALRLASSFRVLPLEGEADDAILENAPRLKAIVVTNDAVLLRRLKEAGVPRIFLRSRSHLVAEGI